MATCADTYESEGRLFESAGAHFGPASRRVGRTARSPLLSVPAEELHHQVIAAHLEVGGHVSEDAGECPDAERAVVRDGDVMLAALRGGQTHVASGLAGDLVAEATQHLRQVGTG